jgi:hypothetical protein
VYRANLEAVDVLGILECESEDALTCFSCDKLNALHDTVYYNMLNARVFSLGVLSDQDGIDVIVRGLVTGDRAAGPNVCEKVECPAEG